MLLVDDDPAAHDLLTASLKGAGYRLVHATNGAEALNLARTIRPDAITLDVIMPTTDGWEVLSALKADADLCDIPVVMVTIVPDRGIGLSLGAVDVLTKPVDRARLTALMHRLLRREGSVLLVEDDADMRDVMRHTIEKMGLPVAEAANGRAALTWLGDHPAPSMILLDLMMPEMDGFGFLDVLAARAEWREIPVIVITAKQLTAVEHDRLLRQVHTVMEKATASKVDIAAAISEALRRRPPRAKGTDRDKSKGMTKVLLVEDNEMNRDMLSRRLTRRGFDVVFAVDGKQGVALARSEKPDIILMDMSLPVMDGWEATRCVKADDATRSVPVIGLTAHAMSGDREKAIEAGCDDYDTKPVEIDRLIGKIERLLGAAKG